MGRFGGAGRQTGLVPGGDEVGEGEAGVVQAAVDRADAQVGSCGDQGEQAGQVAGGGDPVVAVGDQEGVALDRGEQGVLPVARTDRPEVVTAARPLRPRAAEEILAIKDGPAPDDALLYAAGLAAAAA